MRAQTRWADEAGEVAPFVGGEAESGARRFVLAMVRQAVREATEVYTPADIAAEAQHWLLDDDTEALLSFRWCCLHLDLDPGYVRDGLRESVPLLYPKALRVEMMERAAVSWEREARRLRDEGMRAEWQNVGVGAVVEVAAPAPRRRARLSLTRTVVALQIVAACMVYEESRNAQLLRGIYAEECKFWPVLRGVLSPSMVPSRPVDVRVYSAPVDAEGEQAIRGAM